MRMYSHAEFSKFASNCGWCRGYGCFQCGKRYESYLNEEDKKDEKKEDKKDEKKEESKGRE